MSEEADKMFASLQEKVGKSRAGRVVIAKASGEENHGKILNCLKKGRADAWVCQPGAPGSARGNLGRAEWRGPERGAICRQGAFAPDPCGGGRFHPGIGGDYEIVSKKAGVSFRRKKQFVLVEPKTRTRVDIGINLKGHPGTGRLKPVGGMCTHKVSVTPPGKADGELRGWIAAAFAEAG